MREGRERSDWIIQKPPCVDRKRSDRWMRAKNWHEWRLTECDVAMESVTNQRLRSAHLRGYWPAMLDRSLCQRRAVPPERFALFSFQTKKNTATEYYCSYFAFRSEGALFDGLRRCRFVLENALLYSYKLAILHSIGNNGEPLLALAHIMILSYFGHENETSRRMTSDATASKIWWQLF